MVTMRAGKQGVQPLTLSIAWIAELVRALRLLRAVLRS
jgi:hypothetical protein